MATAADAPTGMAPTAAWAAGAAGLAAGRGPAAADGAASATFRALAWSQDDAPAGGSEPVPYTGEDYTFDPAATGAARPPMAFAHEEEGYHARTRTAALVQAADDPVRRGGGRRAAGHRRPRGHIDQQHGHQRSGDRDGDHRRDRAVARGPPATSETITVTRVRRPAEHHGGAASPAVDHHDDDTLDDDHDDHHHHDDDHDHHHDDHPQRPLSRPPPNRRPRQPPTTTDEPIITTTVDVPDVVIPDDGP